MVTKLDRMVTYLDGLPPMKLLDPRSRGLARSRDKRKPLHLHYHRAYGLQTWQVGDLPQEAPIKIATQTFNHVVLLDHMKFT